MKEDYDKAIRQLPSWEGFTGFTIKAKDTEHNQNIHDGFREFCKVECNNDYTQGLQKLIEYYQSDYKYEMIFKEITELQQQVTTLKEQVNPVKKKEDEEDLEVF